ncbi:hypothetical protein CCACVL1_21082, partial [Corchorus capsularis]
MAWFLNPRKINFIKQKVESPNPRKLPNQHFLASFRHNKAE